MKDRLEEFVSKNREALDDKTPGPDVWTAIEMTLFGKKTTWWNSVVLWRAAAVIFLASTLYLTIPAWQAREQGTLALREFNDVEEFYFDQISHKVDLIEDFEGSDGVDGFTRDFQQLEAMYLVLKEEMKVRPSKKVRDALVLNLLVRIDLLNQQLHKLEERDDHRTVPTSSS